MQRENGETKSMTLSEYIDLVDKTHKENKNWRRGQTYFNVLYDLRPLLADEVRGTGHDPFYLDSRITVFLLCLQNHW